MGVSPRFSIIMPTYRRPALLRRAIQSVVNQTFEDFELIVVDDGNDDETPGVVKAFQDRRIALLRHERNQGPAAAYNTGIRASGGEWISFLDDDDEYLPHFLERTLDFVEKADPPVGFVWSGILRVTDSPSGESPGCRTIWPPGFKTRELALTAATSIGNGHGLTVKRECLEQTGLYDETYQVCEDTELLFRLAPRFGFAVIPEVLVKIHSHECGQLTGSKNTLLRLECHERLIGQHRGFVDRYRSLGTVHFKRLVDLSYQAGLKSKGRGWLLQILRVKPLGITIVANWASYELLGKDFRTWLSGTATGISLRRWKHRIVKKTGRR
jgi:glycosyltransferase involved in cell wall biosynthesis